MYNCYTLLFNRSTIFYISLFLLLVCIYLNRRDSFITHRAFCDALAEETARMNAANAHFNLNTAAANNNLNYHHLMGPNLGPAVAMAQHFSSIFRPLSSSSTKQETLDHHHPNPNQRDQLFPLWFNTNTYHLVQSLIKHPTRLN